MVTVLKKLSQTIDMQKMKVKTLSSIDIFAIYLVAKAPSTTNTPWPESVYISLPERLSITPSAQSQDTGAGSVQGQALVCRPSIEPFERIVKTRLLAALPHVIADQPFDAFGVVDAAHLACRQNHPRSSRDA